jgi:hypothetical protein
MALEASEKMDVALRVLNAITNGEQPERGDVSKLERWVPDQPFNHPPDDLARIIVERELEKTNKKAGANGL